MCWWKCQSCSRWSRSSTAGAYHRQMMHEFEGQGIGRVVTPLMRLQDAAYTKIILVTLPDVTPVLQAPKVQQSCNLDISDYVQIEPDQIR
ncbi:hypothetical protein FQ179_19500 [Pusillimonas sp. ANT_WB101]|nr:hypothetical protein FQ179_19500 [Pusillimonas sp. ANT_WB101]